MYQQSSGDPIFGLVGLLVMAAIYFYFAFAQYTLAKKLGCLNDAWWSFIPIMNSLLLIKMGGKEMWWFLLMLVPVVNIVVFAILWIEVAKGVGKSGFLGFCTLIPFVNFITIGILAFTGGNNRQSPFPPKSPSQPPRSPQAVS
ncbi:signal peptidase I [candidate division GN15 bacterium]|jgi:uncharacterized membrane protein YhaH (DUF805 family)|nr:signal peptidase I [candidate division GN15 bacterium]